MIIRLATGYTTSCERCRVSSGPLAAKALDDARAELKANGWDEGRRKGGAAKSAWTCPACQKPQATSGGLTTGHFPGAGGRCESVSQGGTACALRVGHAGRHRAADGSLDIEWDG